MTTILMIGTRKGMWLARSEDRREWSFTGPHHDMEEVYSCLVDTRGDKPRLFAGASSPWLGPQVRFSDDLGETWHDAPGTPKFPEDTDGTVERIWQLVPGVEDGVVYAGVEPGAIFTSTDRGESYQLERALWDHPHRSEWQPGFGGQAFHTVLPHPTDPDSVTAALSAGGVYQTTDGGGSWEPRNRGIRVDFFPEGQSFPEYGQCVHKVTRHPEHPERLYAQNHGGVYRSDDEGTSWTAIHDGLPDDFGFPIVVHPHKPETVYVFPLGGGEGGMGRYPTEAKARVWRSDDAGTTWASYGAGLPDPCYAGVMRDAMCADASDPAGLYLGTRSGEVYASADEGETWQQIAATLPDVMCVKVGTLED